MTSAQQLTENQKMLQQVLTPEEFKAYMAQNAKAIRQLKANATRRARRARAARR